LFHVVGLSLRDVSERYCVTNASRESVRRWFHRFSRLFSVGRRFRNTIAVDETVVKMHGRCLNKPLIIVDRGPWYIR
jgi:transposase-like protein